MLDLADYLRFLVSLLFVLGLIGGLALIARRYGPGFLGRGSTGSRKAGTRRLSVVETLVLDPRRKLAIVREEGSDGAREHLILLGIERETVIESRPAPSTQAIEP